MNSPGDPEPTGKYEKTYRQVPKPLSVRLVNDGENSRYSINMATRGSYAKGIIKRAEILDVALEVFAKEGYRGTSLRKVAHLCNLSLAGVMHYFESKEDLLVQILRKKDLRDEIVGNDVEQQGNLTAVLNRSTQEPGLVALYVTMVAAAADPAHPAAAYFKERYDRLMKLAEDSYYADKPNPTEDELAFFRTMTRASLAMADGLQQQWLVDRDVDVAGTMEAFLQQVRTNVEGSPTLPDTAG
ncbi:TetR/AcrR family transcriptional regulator [Paeniglutamicibacter sp. NPDC091659]|uniref:TetR/AcrR family transcriptional regulator n=1 Tax=Paeniglutamicibacter sp. NPDC091659 TaxID=3364389 RepID=UPI003809ECBE